MTVLRVGMTDQAALLAMHEPRPAVRRLEWPETSMRLLLSDCARELATLCGWELDES